MMSNQEYSIDFDAISDGGILDWNGKQYFVSLKPMVFGFIQHWGDTYPAITEGVIETNGDIYIMIADGQQNPVLCGDALRFYPMSQQEFYRWFGNTSLEDHLVHVDDKVYFFYEQR